MQKLRNFWDNLPDGVRRTAHTVWQVAIPVLLSHLIIAHSSNDVKSAFVVTGATVLATLKAILLQS